MLNYWKIILIAQFILGTLLLIVIGDSDTDYTDGILYLDKVFHFVAFLFYGISTQIFLFSLKEKRPTKRRITISTIIVGFSFSFIIEIIQFFNPDRCSDVFDSIAGCTGVLCSLILTKYIIRAVVILDK